MILTRVQPLQASSCVSWAFVVSWIFNAGAGHAGGHRSFLAPSLRKSVTFWVISWEISN